MMMRLTESKARVLSSISADIAQVLFSGILDIGLIVW